ncbi:MAG: MogA/MoaB family molybdenum cofactor biosynthesis protein [Methanomicrobiales archaeon]|nr:MogA/MoaB family molybdenum cofactor biosynthesis protein [Methanomicrobiales archaeon]MDI6876007.1 MogA/MoaB family molybdenum cofactor biosynthesis protein [Methanomicrobiales archaeon]
MNSGHVRDIKITAAIISVSSSRTPDLDLSGQTIRSLLEKAGIDVTHYAVVPDAVEKIRSELFRAADRSNCIIFNGGTGLTHDDCTIEAIEPLLEKRLDGFGEIFRSMSYAEIGVSAILSRAVAGILRERAVFCIPGSPKAVQLATSRVIIPVVQHMLSHAQR